MKRATVCASIFVLAAASVWLPNAAQAAANVNIGVQTDSMSLGINIGNPPPLVVVPGTPVYRASDLPYNYFVYHKRHYLYHEGRWYRARGYNGPWMAVAIEQVPQPILAVPVRYYRSRPERWKRQGPPPWVEERRHERERMHEGERDHGRGTGHDRGHE